MEKVYTEFALLLLASAGAGFLALRLRQPLLIGYIAVGIIAGPSVLGWVTAQDQIDLLAQIGVTVLLFVVGLKLDLHSVRHIGPVALATGLGQLAFTIILGFLILLALGRDPLTALYVAVALTFSSTIIIVKLLSDKKELDSLHGRIAVGFLIVQDIAVVLAMMVMSALRGAAGSSAPWEVALSLLLRIGIAGAVLFLLMRFVLSRLMGQIARSSELLLIFAIAWGTAFAVLGEWAGFSKEAGAFLAGFSLASTGYREVVGSRLSSMRDFLLLFFFVDLGAKLEVSVLGNETGPALALSLFVLIGNPLIVMVIMGFMGYRRRTGFMAGLTVAQISEFSIVFVAMGITLGHVSGDALGLTTLIGLITITLSTYLILYSEPLYQRLRPLLAVFERRRPFREMVMEEERHETSTPEIVVFGLGRYGGRLFRRLHSAGLDVLGVDFDPEVTMALEREGMHVHFGDCEDLNFLDTLPLDGAQWVVSTLPQPDSHRALISWMKHHGYGCKVAVLARDDSQIALLAAAEADRVLYPFNDAADFAAEELAEHVRRESVPGPVSGATP
ncbi:MAG: cation:proton antiporter [Geobacteraceae bacterium]|nr:cation:proton antiporter [Geobacteraceae bacterium]